MGVRFRPKTIRIEGLFVCDSARVTREDVRQFLWAGLRELRVHARAKGLEKQEEDQLLSIMFDLFHDESESIWAALKSQPTAISPTTVNRFVTSSEQVPSEASPEPFFSDEDKPAPLAMDLSKPLTLLDPDAEFLASFEP